MLNFFVVFPTFAQTSAKYDDLLTLVIQLISAHIKEDPTVRGFKTYYSWCMTRLDLHNPSTDVGKSLSTNTVNAAWSNDVNSLYVVQWVCSLGNLKHEQLIVCVKFLHAKFLDSVCILLMQQNAEPSPITYDVSARARPRLACVSASWQRKPSSDGGSPGGGISLLAPLEK